MNQLGQTVFQEACAEYVKTTFFTRPEIIPGTIMPESDHIDSVNNALIDVADVGDYLTPVSKGPEDREVAWAGLANEVLGRGVALHGNRYRLPGIRIFSSEHEVLQRGIHRDLRLKRSIMNSLLEQFED
jgi:hypothetical protein